MQTMTMLQNKAQKSRKRFQSSDREPHRGDAPMIRFALLGFIVVLLVGCSPQAQNTADQLHIDGIEMINDGRWEEARLLYTRIIEEHSPEDTDALARAHMNRAIALFELGQTKEALADETVVIELAPSNVNLLAQAHLNRGREYGFLDMLDESLADAEAVITLQPGDTDLLAGAHINRAVLRRDLGRPEDAVADLTVALDLDPEPDVHMAASVYRSELLAELGRYEAAIQDATVAINLDTNRRFVVRAYLVRGVSLTAVGQLEPGLDDLSAAIELRPEDQTLLARAHLARAATLFTLERETEAISDLELVTTLLPSTDEFHQIAVELLTELEPN